MKEYLPSGLLVALVIKVLVTGASIGDSFCMLGLAAFAGFHYYIESKKEKSINEEFKLEQIKVRVELEQIKSAMQSMKLLGGLRR